LEEALIFSDVRAFRQICDIFSGKVDFITAGFPCQPFSTAGELKGTNDERWLWDSILEIISKVRPSYLFLENVSNLVNQFGAFDEISKSLSQIGFNLEWGTLRASDIGANHHRNRLFIFGYYKGTIEQIKPIVPYANTDSKRRNQLDNAKESIKEKRKLDNGNNSFGNVTDYIQESGNDANANGINSTKRGKHEVNEKSCSTREDNPPRSKNNGRERRFQISSQIERGEISKFAKYGINQPAYWQNEPSICRVVDGVAFGMDRIRACGNGVVPLQAAIAYYTLIQRAKGVNQ
jgi:DNA (cytosine-5)-methyltransferase 1